MLYQQANNELNKKYINIDCVTTIEKIDLTKPEYRSIRWYNEIDMDPKDLWERIPNRIKDHISLGCIDRTCSNYVYQRNYKLIDRKYRKCFHERPFMSTLDKILEEQPNCRVLDISQKEVNLINVLSTENFTCWSMAVGGDPNRIPGRIDPLLIRDYVDTIEPIRKVYYNWFDLAKNFIKLKQPENMDLTPLEQLLFVCKDQDGSRYIQRKLDTFKPQHVFGSAAVEASEEWEYLLLLIVEALPQMASGLFSNYVIQKLMDDEINHETLKTYLFVDGIKSLSVETYGCRVVQKGIEVLEDIELFYKEIMENLEHLVSDQNANHVVQKLIDVAGKRSFINKEIIKGGEDNLMIIRIIKKIENSIILLSNKKFGCRVIQKLLEVINHISNCSNNFCPKYSMVIEKVNKLKSEVLENILESIPALATHEFGNYVLQYIINEVPNSINEISMILSGDALMYSTHKFASNVVENVIVKGNSITQGLLLEAFCKYHVEEGRSKHILFYLARDRYGNYVIQQLYEHFTNGRERIINILKRYTQELKKNDHFRYVFYKLTCNRSNN